VSAQTFEKPTPIKCPKCGNTEFNIKYSITVCDTLYFDEETGQPKLVLDDPYEKLAGISIGEDADVIECTKCGEKLPKEIFKGLRNIKIIP
jgi:predicted RNA-binding Zn-ribbon protein involved in translation (DUF1610 family)